ncbi:uncharacterized protein ASPGLDRAFT_123734 [Aspergillus glaucus CBS 516.65]|uniref:NAD-dependent epimerase/dehydratase domain-containing protein n=1 Tax=Aspergillus glaucus CBS 516.65 TaxID=1160497 RepID=A0A1L9VP56_ASPGL|nr:hypothetical protein ASPGLDRAFT_123734 [Aspergillus glaucus CBS 516.65]OJJ85713.1 hypothetical protein ASPGLDRAFT_123734 [Aspergillus glaucus CBS 516.65]
MTKTILITGVNGYLASNIATAVLNAGYRLRGTCRSKERASRLLNGPWKPYVDRIEIAEVPDLCEVSGFDEAVKGVSAIIHTAAPVIGPSITHASQLITPTVKGTENLLNSALAYAGSQLESFVFTSSAAAVITPGAQPPHTYDDNSWNKIHPLLLEDGAENISVYEAYPCAKIAAEKLVWAFRDTKKPPFAISVICGSIATGPPIILPETADKLPLTLAPVYNGLIGKDVPGPQDSIVKIAGSTPYVDVRNLAAIYIWCAENTAQSDGERYLVVAGHGPKQAILDILSEEYPERRGVILKGNPDQRYNKDWTFDEGGVVFDSTKVKNAVGLHWIPYGQSIIDTAKSLEPLLEAEKEGLLI